MEQLLTHPPGQGGRDIILYTQKMVPCEQDRQKHLNAVQPEVLKPRKGEKELITGRVNQVALFSQGTWTVSGLK